MCIALGYKLNETRFMPSLSPSLTLRVKDGPPREGLATLADGF